MEEDSNLPPSKRRRSLNLKKCYVCQDESIVIRNGKIVFQFLVTMMKVLEKR